MLSASTYSSSPASSSSAFSASPGLSTPSSQYSTDSGRKGGGNPLTELIDTEQAYMETLKMIDSQIAPIWMKQMTSAAPDFSELLKYIHGILKVNKRFCIKLTRIAANPQTISELGDALMQWVNDLEVPYANYCRSFIMNLNQRNDIAGNPSIQEMLRNLSTRLSYEINLEALFNAPIQQLKYYKGLYGRLLDGTDAGRADHKLLMSANKRIDMIMALLKGSSHVNVNYKESSLPHIQTDFNATQDLATFERQVDCSRTADLYSGTQIHYQLCISNPGTQLVMKDSFVMLTDHHDGPSIRVCLALTTDVLVIARELSSSQFMLLYPAIPIGDITVRADAVDREIVGEYMIRFSVLSKKHLIMRADSKEIRNTWIGVESSASKSLILTPRTMSVAAQKKMLSTASAAAKSYGIGLPPMPADGKRDLDSNKAASIRNTDIFTYYSGQGGVSPLESSDEDDNKGNNGDSKNQGKSRDTIMDIYDNHLYDYGNASGGGSGDNDNDDTSKFPTPPLKPSISNKLQIQNVPTPPNKDRSNVKKDGFPPVPPKDGGQPVNEPVKESSHVQMTYIQPPTAQMSSMSISPPIPQSNQINTPAAGASLSSSSSTSSPNMSYSNRINPLPSSSGVNSKPSSPRAVEVQRVVLPQILQAVTQKTDDYLSSSSSSNKTLQPETSRFQPVANNAMARPLPSQQQQQQLPRISSMRGQQPYPQQQQQRPPMIQSNSYSTQSQLQNQSQMTMNVQPHQQRPLPPSPQSQYGYNGNAMNTPSAHHQQQQYRPAYGGSASSPITPHSPNNKRAPGGQPLSPGLQQPPGRFNSPSPSQRHMMNSVQDYGSPPHNPGNDVRQILYSSSQCDVFHWKNQSWYAAEGQCLLQVRLTHSHRTCVAVQLQNTGQLYLNAWILPNTVIRQPSPTDVSISLYMGTKKENYLVHFAHPQDATVFFNILNKAHHESGTAGPLQQQQQQQQQQQNQVQRPKDEPEVVDNVNVPQTLKLVMQCKAKLFVQNETSNWSTFGNVTMRISQQSPSMRMMIQIENDKTKLVSAIVKSGNVERISPKRITFLLSDESAKTSIVYMIHLKEDRTGSKIYEYLRTENAENGW